MYHCEIDEQKFLSAAEKIVSTGLKDAGYNYVNSEPSAMDSVRCSKW